MQKWHNQLNLSLLQLYPGKPDCIFKPPGNIALFQNIGEEKFWFSLSSGIFQDKLVWIFNAFDKDGGGTIDYGEIRLKKDFDCLENDFAPRDIVVDLFRMAEIDQNEDLVMACVTDIRLDLPSIGEAVNSHS